MPDLFPLSEEGKRVVAGDSFSRYRLSVRNGEINQATLAPIGGYAKDRTVRRSGQDSFVGRCFNRLEAESRRGFGFRLIHPEKSIRLACISGRRKVKRLNTGSAPVCGDRRQRPGCRPVLHNPPAGVPLQESTGFHPRPRPRRKSRLWSSVPHQGRRQ